LLAFSVCISVYNNDKPEYLRQALDSIIFQSVPPSEIVLVVDGPVSFNIDILLEEYQQRYVLLKVIRLEKNMGLGYALNKCIENSSNDFIARMDGDDISMPNRFELQIECFEKDQSLSIVGGTIAEFIDNKENVISFRRCPESDKLIKKYMKSRCGLNHVTVMMKKSDVSKAGNYQDWFRNEDYYLWLRMMRVGCKFKNLSETLVNVRVGKDMYARRGGYKYFNSEIRLQKYMLTNNLIGITRYFFNVSIRFIVEILSPNYVRSLVFRTFLRK
jgi:glycosyltransferase involved in cell wall biosynthesis